MSKYDRLHDFLCNAVHERRRMSFAEIERVLGIALPKSARRYQAWWANDASAGRQSNAWLSAGWRTEDLDLGGETVTFLRDGTVRNPVSRQRLSDTPRDLETAPDGRVRITLDMHWKQLGDVALAANGTLSFPTVHDEPGLYRLRLLHQNGHRHYVGESGNLRRRFGNYRNPGPSQATSIRINAVLQSHLDAGGRIAVDVILSDIMIGIGGANTAADLSDKYIRRLLEQAALVADGAADVESLNR